MGPDGDLPSSSNPSAPEIPAFAITMSILLAGDTFSAFRNASSWASHERTSHCTKCMLEYIQCNVLNGEMCHPYFDADKSGGGG